MQNFVFCETLFEHFKFLMYDCLNGYSLLKKMYFPDYNALF